MELVHEAGERLAPQADAVPVELVERRADLGEALAVVGRASSPPAPSPATSRSSAARRCLQRLPPVAGRAAVPEEEAEVAGQEEPGHARGGPRASPRPRGRVMASLRRTVRDRDLEGAPFRDALLGASIRSGGRPSRTPGPCERPRSCARRCRRPCRSEPRSIVVSPDSSKCGVRRVTRTSGGRVRSSRARRPVQENRRSATIRRRPRLSCARRRDLVVVRGGARLLRLPRTRSAALLEELDLPARPADLRWKLAVVAARWPRGAAAAAANARPATRKHGALVAERTPARNQAAGSHGPGRSSTPSRRPPRTPAAAPAAPRARSSNVGSAPKSRPETGCAGTGKASMGQLVRRRRVVDVERGEPAPFSFSA